MLNAERRVGDLLEQSRKLSEAKLESIRDAEAKLIAVRQENENVIRDIESAFPDSSVRYLTAAVNEAVIAAEEYEEFVRHVRG